MTPVVLKLEKELEWAESTERVRLGVAYWKARAYDDR